jgi:hypothetical protein
MNLQHTGCQQLDGPRQEFRTPCSFNSCHNVPWLLDDFLQTLYSWSKFKALCPGIITTRRNTGRLARSKTFHSAGNYIMSGLVSPLVKDPLLVVWTTATTKTADPRRWTAVIIIVGFFFLFFLGRGFNSRFDFFSWPNSSSCTVAPG